MVRLFGTTVRETIDAFQGAHLGRRPRKETESAPGDRAKAMARLIVSLGLLVVATVLIVVDRSNSQSIGQSVISFVVGYWLK